MFVEVKIMCVHADKLENAAVGTVPKLKFLKVTRVACAGISDVFTGLVYSNTDPWVFVGSTINTTVTRTASATREMDKAHQVNLLHPF